MKTLLVLIVGAVLGVAAYMYLKEPQSRPAIEEATGNVAEGAGKVRDKLSQTFTNINADEIKSELEQSGRVIRRKAEQAGTAIKDATADARITAEIKSKYAMEKDLSALRISVNTTDGIVTLAGSASSAEEIKKAMNIAIQMEGVREVVSTIQIKQARD